MSSFTGTPNFDNLLLQSLMDRLQIRPPATAQNHPFSPSLEDLLLDAFNDISDQSDGETSSTKSQLSREESKLEKEIIRIIRSGMTDALKPNSGQAVTIGEHHICLGFHEEQGSEYRVWEWHGHIMLFDEENGYNPEYIYGNYFERLLGKASRGGGAAKLKENEEEEEEETKEEEKVVNLGLRELIEGGDCNGGARILHRSINGSSQRMLRQLLYYIGVLEIWLKPRWLLMHISLSGAGLPLLMHLMEYRESIFLITAESYPPATPQKLMRG